MTGTLAMLWMMACSPPPTAPPVAPVPAPSPAPVSVLWITLDTTRRDALGTYGASPSVTPVLDALAAEAAVFEDAWTTAPLTLPAHTSMMTGLYPASHGVRDNVTSVLPPQALTLAEVLRDNGLATVADVAADTLARAQGLDQGFDSYTAPWPPQTSTPFTVTDRPADQMADLAVERLSTLEGPFFYWLHLFDPHAPHNAPGHSYQDELAFVDAQLGRVLQALADRPDARQVVVLVTSDHGESLGDTPEPTHGYLLSDATMRVPLLIRAPGMSPQRVPDQVSLVDLMPTVLDLLDIEPPSSGFDGVNLTPRLTNDQTLPPRTLALESYEGWIRHGWAPLEAVVAGPWKLVHTRMSSLYNRDEDPAEADNVYVHDHPEVPRLRGALHQHFTNLAHRLPRVQRLSKVEQDAVVQALGDKGSVHQRHVERPKATQLPDVLEMLPIVQGLAAAATAEADGRTDEAITLLQDLSERSPQSPTLHALLGAALVRHRPDEAARAQDELHRALILDPEQVSCHNHLAALAIRRAVAAQEQGDQEAALAEFNQAEHALRLSLRLQANQPEPLANLARLVMSRADAALRAGRRAPATQGFQQAAELMQRSIDLMPPDAAGRDTLVKSRTSVMMIVEKLRGKKK